MKITVLQDIYLGIVQSTNPGAFVKILRSLFGGKTKNQPGSETHLWTLNRVGTWKIAKNPTGSNCHIPLRVTTDWKTLLPKISRLSKRQGFTVFVNGRDHWRIIEFVVGGSIIGAVHLANRG